MEEHEDAKDSDTGDTTAVPETAAAALTRAELHEATTTWNVTLTDHIVNHLHLQ